VVTSLYRSERRSALKSNPALSGVGVVRNHARKDDSSLNPEVKVEIRGRPAQREWGSSRSGNESTETVRGSEKQSARKSLDRQRRTENATPGSGTKVDSCRVGTSGSSEAEQRRQNRAK
jgi:hypothetical protein